MALHETTNRDGLFFTLKHGGFCLEASEPTEGYTETEVPNPSTGKMVTKWLRIYPGMDGKITNIAWSDREHDGVRYVSIKLTITDAGEVYGLDLPFGKRHYNYFMRVVDSIDFEKPLDFIAYPKKDENGRPYTELLLKQDGKMLIQNYTRANPGDCPQTVQDEMGKWDNRARHIWLKNHLTNVIIPKVAALNVTGDDDTPEPEPIFTGQVEKPKTKAAKAKAAPKGEFWENEPDLGPTIEQDPPEDVSPDDDLSIPF